MKTIKMIKKYLGKIVCLGVKKTLFNLLDFA